MVAVGVARNVSCVSPLTESAADDSTGFFVQPTVVLTKDPKSVTMVDEIFGPVLTVGTAL